MQGPLVKHRWRTLSHWRNLVEKTRKLKLLGPKENLHIKQRPLVCKIVNQHALAKGERRVRAGLPKDCSCSTQWAIPFCPVVERVIRVSRAAYLLKLNLASIFLTTLLRVGPPDNTVYPRSASRVLFCTFFAVTLSQSFQ